MARNEQGKAVLPLIEMTIALSVLAVCSVITVSLFLYAHFAGEASQDMNSALMLAQSKAEKLHSADNIELETAIFYDELWQETEDDPEFTMEILLNEEKGKNASLYSGSITIEKVKKYPFLSDERKILVTLPVKIFQQKGELPE